MVHLSSLSFYLGPRGGPSIATSQPPAICGLIFCNCSCFRDRIVTIVQLLSKTYAFYDQCNHTIRDSWLRVFYHRIISIFLNNVFFMPTCPTSRTMSWSTFLLVSPVAGSCHSRWQKIMMIRMAPGLSSNSSQISSRTPRIGAKITRSIK